MDLPQSDLIRNYILMGLETNEQNNIYRWKAWKCEGSVYPMKMNFRVFKEKLHG